MFQNGGIYHVYNRGVDKRTVFESPNYYDRFLLSMDLFNDVKSSYSVFHKTRMLSAEKYSNEPREQLVSILCFCLLPNHFHLLLRQEKTDGVALFMMRLMGGFTKYFNALNSRSGSLFQGKYKRKEVTSDHYLSYLASYINGNSEIHRICKASEWPYCSLKSFANNNDSKFAKPSIVYNLCDRPGQFWDFQNEVIRNALTVKEEYASLILDDE